MVGGKHDLAVADEHQVGEDVFDFLDLVGGDEDGLVLVEVVFQQALVELLAVEDVQPQRGFVQHQQACVDGHHDRQVQLHDHALGHLAHPLVGLQLGAGQEALALGAVEARMHTGDEVDRFAARGSSGAARRRRR